MKVFKNKENLFIALLIVAIICVILTIVFFAFYLKKKNNTFENNEVEQKEEYLCAWSADIEGKYAAEMTNRYYFTYDVKSNEIVESKQVITSNYKTQEVYFKVLSNLNSEHGEKKESTCLYTNDDSSLSIVKTCTEPLYEEILQQKNGLEEYLNRLEEKYLCNKMN